MTSSSSFQKAVAEYQFKLSQHIEEFSKIPNSGYTYISAHAKMEELVHKINTDKQAILSKLYAMLPEHCVSASNKSKLTSFQRYVADEIEKINRSYRRFMHSYNVLVDSMGGVR